VTATIFDLGAVPVIVPDLPEVDYHASPALSSTGARTLLDSPARFQWQRQHPITSETFDFGTTVHTMVLGVGAEPVPLDFDSWRTKASQEAAAEVRAAGDVPMLRDAYDAARSCADAVLADRRAKAILARCDQREVSMFAEDPATGVAMRARLDLYGAGDEPLAADLKTAASAADDDFARAAANYGYAVQMAWYQHVRALVTGDDTPIPFRFVVVEKSPPYLVNVIELDAEFVQIGRSQVDRALRTYAECVERYGDGPWPGYGNPDEPDEPNLIGPPAWFSYSEGMEL